MSVLGTYLLGLIVAHVAWLYFFVTGQLLWRRHSEDPESAGLSAFIITSVAGMALSGFGLVFMGFAHLLNGFGIVGVLILEAVLFRLLKGDNWLSLIFWRRTLQSFVRGWTVPAFFIYVLFLALGVPAILPPTGGDPVSYHLAYAADWANAGRIYVDPFLRFPYYANNFLLFDSAFFILKLGSYCHFLTWLCGLLTCLGVLAFFAPSEFYKSDGALRGSHFQPQQFLIPLTVALSPVFLRYLNNGYVDVPIGLFIVVSVLCVYKTSSHQPFAREFTVIAAFCVGMKLTLIGHLPFFIISLFLVSVHRVRRREMALLFFILVGLSLPWYIRNLIVAHDPTPPIFNFIFKHPNPIFTRADIEIYSTGTESYLMRPVLVPLLPFLFFAKPYGRPFLEPGVSAMIFLVYAPFIFLVVRFCRKNRWRTPNRLLYLSTAAAYLALPWFFNADGRHALHWYPVLAGWVGVMISLICMRIETLWDSRLTIWTTRITATAFCCVLIIPSPTSTSLQTYRDYYAQTRDFMRLRGNRRRYLEKSVPGYLAGEIVMETLTSEHKEQTHVLALGVNPHFYFRKNANIISVGDYFGPARYTDLFEEVTNSKGCLSYLTRLDISAVITRPDRGGDWWPSFYKEFRKRLRNCGYKEYRCNEQNIAVFLKSDIKPSRRLDQAG